MRYEGGVRKPPALPSGGIGLRPKAAGGPNGHPPTELGLLRRRSAAEAAHVRGLRDGLAFHRGEQLGAARGVRQVEIRAERVELEYVVVIARAGRRARAEVRILAGNVLTLHRARGQAAFRNTLGRGRD